MAAKNMWNDDNENVGSFKKQMDMNGKNAATNNFYYNCWTADDHHADDDGGDDIVHWDFYMREIERKNEAVWAKNECAKSTHPSGNSSLMKHPDWG